MIGAIFIFGWNISILLMELTIGIFNVIAVAINRRVSPLPQLNRITSILNLSTSDNSNTTNYRELNDKVRKGEK